MGKNRLVSIEVGDRVLDCLCNKEAVVVAIEPIRDLTTEVGEVTIYESWKGNMIRVNTRTKGENKSKKGKEEGGWRYEWEVELLRKGSKTK